jgi:hypothetical protein
VLNRQAGRLAVWEQFGQASTIETGVSPSKEQGGSETEVGDPVSMGFGNPLDHSVQTKVAGIARNSSPVDRSHSRIIRYAVAIIRHPLPV